MPQEDEMQWQLPVPDLYRQRALSLPGEPRTCPGLSPINSHRPGFLICSSGMGRLKTWTQTQTEGEHVGNNPQRYWKNKREIFTHHEDTPSNKNSLNFPQAPWVLYPGEAQCEPRSIFTMSRALVGTPWHSAIFPLFYFYCPWKRSSSARNPCEEQPSKTTPRTWQKPTCKARKCLMELEAWDTLIQPILLLEEWELCE